MEENQTRIDRHVTAKFIKIPDQSMNLHFLVLKYFKLASLNVTNTLVTRSACFLSYFVMLIISKMTNICHSFGAVVESNYRYINFRFFTNLHDLSKPDGSPTQQKTCTGIFLPQRVSAHFVLRFNFNYQALMWLHVPQTSMKLPSPAY